jgi:hypothetical protein
MVKLLTRIIGVGIETADMLVHEILSRQLRDRRAVVRYAQTNGAPEMAIAPALAAQAGHERELGEA